MFCENCKSIVFPKGGKYVCKKCGHEGGKAPDELIKAEKKAEGTVKADKDVVSKEAQDAIEDDVPIVGESSITLNKTKVYCEKCGHPEAYFYIRQTRSADEPSTTFYRCCKCNHSWREN